MAGPAPFAAAQLEAARLEAGQLAAGKLAAERFAAGQHAAGQFAAERFAAARFAAHQWRRSSHSTDADTCVEVAEWIDGVAVRDSKDVGGPVLGFGRSEWRAFLSGVRAGRFDLHNRR
jgi:hypothetical protein